MTVKQFLIAISDEQGAIQTTAAYLIETMQTTDFDELMLEMKKMSAETWEEREQIAIRNKKEE